MCRGVTAGERKRERVREGEKERERQREKMKNSKCRGYRDGIKPIIHGVFSEKYFPPNYLAQSNSTYKGQTCDWTGATGVGSAGHGFRGISTPGARLGGRAGHENRGADQVPV